jgi:PIN domain nuclease of toxin-antitoxin system
VKLLLDTHVWLWWLAEPERLGSQARKEVGNPSNAVYLSAASSWELTVKHALGRLPLPEPPLEFVPKRLQRDQILALPVTHVHALTVGRLPPIHRDPFDRLLIAQAIVEDLTLCTVDPLMLKYEVPSLHASE